MSSTGVPNALKEESTRNIRQLLKVIILFTIAGAAVSSRLFSVIRKLALLDRGILEPLSTFFGEENR